MTDIEDLFEAVSDIENIVEEVADPDDLIADFVANPLMFGKSKLRLCGCGELNQPIECT